MIAKRAASFVVLAIFLAGCVTPSGIVDNFVPPQGQPVVAQLETPTCEEAIARDPAEGKVQNIVPCVVEVLTIAARPANGVVGPIRQQRPRPPRIGR